MPDCKGPGWIRAQPAAPQGELSDRTGAPRRVLRGGLCSLQVSSFPGGLAHRSRTEVTRAPSPCKRGTLPSPPRCSSLSTGTGSSPVGGGHAHRGRAALLAGQVCMGDWRPARRPAPEPGLALQGEPSSVSPPGHEGKALGTAPGTLRGCQEGQLVGAPFHSSRPPATTAIDAIISSSFRSGPHHSVYF